MWINAKQPVIKLILIVILTIFKRDAVNPILNILSKASSAIFPACKITKSICFVSILQSYDCKQVPVGLMHAEKMAEVVVLIVSKTGFPASLLLFSQIYCV